MVLRNSLRNNFNIQIKSRKGTHTSLVKYNNVTKLSQVFCKYNCVYFMANYLEILAFIDMSVLITIQYSRDLYLLCLNV